MLKLIKKIIKFLVLIIYNILFLILPTNKKVIIFESSVGRNYTGNPKAIYEEMVKKELDYKYKCIWVLNDINKNIPGNCVKVKRLRIRYFYYMIVSRFWIMDSRQPSYLKKKKSNIYIQTWHGTPLKKLGLDMNFVNMGGHKNIQNYKKTFKKNSSRWDYLISQNSYSSDIFKHAFSFDKEILQIGYPRNDILLHNNEINLKNIKRNLGIYDDRKIILYAPTWRDNKYDKRGNYKFQIKIDLEAFKNKFKNDYILILKPHYLVADKIDISKYDNNVKLCGIDYDIQQLYLISDILITDYSSVMFDFSILRKPIIFYMYDLEEYTTQIREFYFDILKEAPGPIVTNNLELFKTINDINSIYQNKYKKFYNEFCRKYNSNDNGTASDSIIKLIQSYN